MSHKVDFDHFIAEVLDSVPDLPDDLTEALKDRMSQADSARKTDIQKLLEEAGHD